MRGSSAFGACALATAVGWWCLLVALCCTDQAAAARVRSLWPRETIVNETVSAHAVWTRANSPYRITRHVILDKNVTLTIEPGVIIRLDYGRSFYINGRLMAVGTPEDPIVFTSSTLDLNPDGSYPADRPASVTHSWGSIVFSPTSPRGFVTSTGQLRGSVLRHCIIEYGGRAAFGTFSSLTAMVQLWDSYPLIRDDLISRSYSKGIYIKEIAPRVVPPVSPPPPPKETTTTTRSFNSLRDFEIEMASIEEEIVRMEARVLPRDEDSLRAEADLEHEATEFRRRASKAMSFEETESYRQNAVRRRDGVDRRGSEEWTPSNDTTDDDHSDGNADVIPAYVIKNCRFERNFGDGIYILQLVDGHGPFEFKNCSFLGNRRGGVYASLNDKMPTGFAVSNCYFKNNVRGASVAVSSTYLAEIVDNIFDGNEGGYLDDYTDSVGLPGIVYLSNVATFNVMNNSFAGNTGYESAALYIYRYYNMLQPNATVMPAHSEISGNRFYNNSASIGAAIKLSISLGGVTDRARAKSSVFPTPIVIRENLIDRNVVSWFSGSLFDISIAYCFRGMANFLRKDQFQFDDPVDANMARNVDDLCSSLVQIRRNVIANTTVKVVNNRSPTGTTTFSIREGSPLIANNSISNPQLNWELINNNPNTGGMVSAQCNWWGTPSTDIIASRIFDFKQNDEKGLASYIPFLLHPGLDGDASFDDPDSSNFNGTILSHNTTWSPIAGPIMLNQSVYVPYDVTLTIEPGVQLLLNKVHIVVDGRIIANGTDSQPITIAPVNSASSWKQITFTRYSKKLWLEGSLLRNVDISGGADWKGKSQDNAAMIRLEEGTLTVDKSRLHNSVNGAALSMEGTSTFVTLTSTEISDNNGYGMKGIDIASLTVDNCTIARNMRDALLVDFVRDLNELTRSSRFTMTHSVVKDNWGCGVCVLFAEIATIAHNRVTNNTVVDIPPRNSGLPFYSSSTRRSAGLDLSYLGDSEVVNNTVLANRGREGGGIYFFENRRRNLLVADNVIADNSANQSFALSVMTSGQAQLRNNTFTGNGRLSRWSPSPAQALSIRTMSTTGAISDFVDNTIADNHLNVPASEPGTAVISALAVDGPGPLLVSRNRFRNGNYPYEFANRNPVTSDVFSATLNWWGVSTWQEIEPRILHFITNDTLALVRYSPFYPSSDFSVPAVDADISIPDVNDYPLIFKNVTWANDVTLRRTVMVTEGATLTLLPSVTVAMDPGVSLIVAGTIVARGDQAGQVRFVRNSGAERSAANNWGRILLTKTSTNSELADCLLEGGGNFNDRAAAMLTIEGHAHAIERCRFAGSASTGVSLRNMVGSSLVVSNSVIEDSARDGLEVVLTVNDKLPANLLVRDNVIRRSGAAGVRMDVRYDVAQMRFLENRIENNTQGVDVAGFRQRATLLFSENVVAGNGRQFVDDPSKAVSGGALRLVVDGSATVTVQQNKFVDNVGNIGAINLNAFAGDFGSTRITGNHITHNVANIAGAIYATPGFSGDRFSFDRNVITYNTANKDGIVYLRTYAATEFTHNTLLWNKVYSCPKYTFRWHGQNAASPIVRNNNFFNPANRYELWISTPLATSIDAMDAAFNWWGVLPQEVPDKIFDYQDVDDLARARHHPPLLSAIGCDSGDCVPPGAYPRLVYSGMTRSGAGLLAHFDRPTDRGNIRRTVDCGQLLANSPDQLAFLGHDAKCLWVDNMKLLAIFGSQATIMPGNYITLKGGIVGDAITNEKAPLMTVDICPPDIRVVPTAVIVAPKFVGQNDGVLLDGRLSYGSGGRPLEYKWEVKDPFTHKNIRDYLNTHASSTNASVFVPSRLLVSPIAGGPSESTFVFYLTVTNYLRERSFRAEAQVVKRGVVMPTIFIEGPANRTVLRRQPILLKGGAKMPKCYGVDDQDQQDDDCGEISPNSDEHKLTFEWTEITGKLSLDGVSGANTRELFIPPFFLDLNAEYVFQLKGELRLDDGTALFSVANVSMFVDVEPIVALIEGGDRSHARSLALVLNASASFDPNWESNSDFFHLLNVDVVDETASTTKRADEEEGGMKFDYRWWCEEYETRNSCFDFEENGVDNTLPVLAVPPNSLRPGMSIFWVQVSINFDYYRRHFNGSQYAGFLNRTAEDSAINASVAIEISDLPIPDVTIDLLSDRHHAIGDSQWVVNSDARLVLWGDARIPRQRADRDFSYKWETVAGDADLTDPSLCPTGDRAISLVLLPGALVAGQSYAFRLTATSKDNPDLSGYAQVALIANLPPVGGNCHVEPKIGYALETPFSLWCENWADIPADMPLRYSFAYLSTDGREVALGDVVDKPTLTAYLPYPSPFTDDDETPVASTLVAYIWDAKRSRARFVVGAVELLPPKSLVGPNSDRDARDDQMGTDETPLTYLNQQALLSARQTLDSDAILQIAQSLTDVYNQLENSLARRGLATVDRLASVVDARRELFSFLVDDVSEILSPTEHRVDQQVHLLRSLFVNEEKEGNADENSPARVARSDSSLRSKAIAFLRDTLEISPKLLDATHQEAVSATSSIMSTTVDGEQADANSERLTLRDAVTQIVDRISKSVLQGNTPDERAIALQSPNIQLTSKRLYADQVVDAAFSLQPQPRQAPLASVDFPAEVRERIDGEPFVEIALLTFGYHPLYSVSTNVDSESEDDDKKARRLATNVTSVELRTAQSQRIHVDNLRSEIVLDLPVSVPPHVDVNEHNAVCAFWDTDTRRWSTSGCVLREILRKSPKLRFVSCACNHLTDFGVLMSADGDDKSSSSNSGDEDQLKIAIPVTAGVLLAISALAFVGSATAFVLYKRRRRHKREKALLQLGTAMSRDSQSDPMEAPLLYSRNSMDSRDTL